MENKDIRKLVSIKKIDKLKEIEGADLIELAIIGGWQAVVMKGQFEPNEEVIYFEIDSFLPDTVEQFKFLTDKSSKEVISPAGTPVKGHVLKTIRLRGELSQGLVQKINIFEGLSDLLEKSENKTETAAQYFKDLGVFKYEKPLPLDGDIIGQYPSFTIKTDSERVQNLSDEILQNISKNLTWKGTEKIDGTSSTWWKDEEGKIHVASRNYEIQIKPNSVYSKIIVDYGLDTILKPGDILKCEIAGEGIQGNPLKIQGKKLFIFDWESENEFPKELEEYKAPVYNFEFPKTVEEALEQVNGLKSLVNPNVQAEGIVWWNEEGKPFKELDYRPNFKAINNKFLLKNG